MALIAAFAVTISVCAIITVPTAIPFTMQTFGIFLAVNILGGKKGTLAILVYIALGAIGLPVFSGGTAGIGILIGKTGGYMLGFVLYGLLAWLVETFTKSSVAVSVITMLIGLALCYTLGASWFLLVTAKSGSSVNLRSVLYVTVLPFVIPDLIKLALAVPISQRLKKLMHR